MGRHPALGTAHGCGVRGRGTGVTPGCRPRRNGVGKYQFFSNMHNAIYWHPNVSGGHANQIGGAILDKWAETGYESGSLGYPTSREFGGGRNSRGNHFQRVRSTSVCATYPPARIRPRDRF
ncbi:LGFP repeat-containing protein [Nocardia farcinica]|uniref:LGFP repeat-containing protein n=1 Tax=Nocardia farcinica TaxID=37329 RepID=UPI002B4B6128|nr:hypothetical protein [Nocardia farcinica]